MPSGGGGGTQVQPATASFGGNPLAYIPTDQPAADMQYQTLLNSLFNQFQAGNTPGQQFAPLAAGTIGNIANNPFALEAQQGGITGAGYGQNAAAQGAGFENFLGSLPTTLTGIGQQLTNNAAYTDQYAPQVAAGIGPLQQGAGTVLNTAFDPRSDLYNSLLNKTQQQSAVSNAQSGVYGPYAAGSSNDAISNFNIDWQNQQLARQAQGLQAASGAYGQAGRLGADAAGIYGAGSGMLGQAANVYGNTIPADIAAALGIGGQAAGLAAQSSALPYQAYQGQQQNISNALTPGLAQLNQQYSVPQGLMNDIQSYLGLGQSASQLGGQLGAQGFNQNQAQLSNIGSLFNAGIGGGGLSSLLYGSQGGGLSNAIGLGQGGLIGSVFGGGGLDAGAAGAASGFGDAFGGAGAFSAGDLLPLLAVGA